MIHSLCEMLHFQAEFGKHEMGVLLTARSPLATRGEVEFGKIPTSTGDPLSREPMQATPPASP